ncbi:MAG: hypothetical protein HQK55_11835 [Deltaproteobacteria bacterium]|nr:hypothetical protein [Deltaproteobacteria bacterium]
MSGIFECEKCEFKGYSADICKLHHKMNTKQLNRACHGQTGWNGLKSSLAVGAGAAILTTLAGVAAAPALGLKAAFDLALALKIGVGAGVGAAALNVAKKKKPSKLKISPSKKRKKILLPLS